jgi:hypothetical protein
MSVEVKAGPCTVSHASVEFGEKMWRVQVCFGGFSSRMEPTIEATIESEMEDTCRAVTSPRPLSAVKPTLAYIGVCLCDQDNQQGLGHALRKPTLKLRA